MFLVPIGDYRQVEAIRKKPQPKTKQQLLSDTQLPGALVQFWHQRGLQPVSSWQTPRCAWQTQGRSAPPQRRGRRPCSTAPGWRTRLGGHIPLPSPLRDDPGGKSITTRTVPAFQCFQTCFFAFSLENLLKKCWQWSTPIEGTHRASLPPKPDFLLYPPPFLPFVLRSSLP